MDYTLFYYKKSYIVHLFLKPYIQPKEMVSRASFHDHPNGMKPLLLPPGLIDLPTGKNELPPSLKRALEYRTEAIYSIDDFDMLMERD